MAVSGISTMGITRLAALAGSPSTIQASVTTSATRNATLSIGTGLTNTWGIALDTKSGYLFVSDGGGQDVAAINGATNTLVSDIKVENGSIDPTGIAYDPVNDNVYVADQGGGDVTVIGGSNLTVWKHIGIGTAPTLAWGAFFDPAANEVFVSYNANHKLTVIDCTSNAVVGNFTSGNGNSPTGGSAFGWAYDPYSQQIFQGGHPVELLAINAAKPWNATNISVYGTPTGVAYDSKNGNVYLSTYPVGIINGTNDTVFGSLSNATTGCGGYSCSMAYDSANNQLYLETGSTVLNYNATTGTPGGNIAAPGYQLIYDSKNKNLYVTTDGTSITAILAGPAPQSHVVTFQTTLAPGLSWSVKVGGSRLYSASDLLAFSEKRGNYSYTVFPPKGYSATPSTGAFHVAGRNFSVNITLTATKFFSVAFHESGLPPGFQWSVSVNGAGTPYGTKGTSSAGSLSLRMPNGLWSFGESVPSGYPSTPRGVPFGSRGQIPPPSTSGWHRN